MTEVTAAVIWRGDKFLICQRPREKYCGLLWEFPDRIPEIISDAGKICTTEILSDADYLPTRAQRQCCLRMQTTGNYWHRC